MPFPMQIVTGVIIILDLGEIPIANDKVTHLEDMEAAPDK